MLTSDDEQTLDFLRSTPAGGQVLAAITALRISSEAARKANSNEARHQAQESAIAAANDLAVATGIADIRRSRAYNEAHNAEDGEVVTPAMISKWLTSDALYSTAGRVTLRNGFAKSVIDDSAMWGNMTSALAANIIWTAQGADGPLAVSLWEREPISGVDTDSGGALAVRWLVMNQAGYTVGAEGINPRRVPNTIWERGAKLACTLAAKSNPTNRANIKPVSSAAVRDWRSRPDIKPIFDRAVKEGAADRAVNAIRPELLLSRA